MRWENRCTTLRMLLGLAVLLAVPHLSSLLGKELLLPAVEPLDRLLDIHRYREVTGYLGLGLVLAGLAVTLRPGGMRLPFMRQQSRAIHILVGLLLLLVVLLHTGGSWGVNLNGFLLGSLQLAIFIALIGKFLENRRLESRGAGVGRIRAVWLPAHLISVAALLVFLVFHILSVYYF